MVQQFMSPEHFILCQKEMFLLLHSGSQKILARNLILNIDMYSN